MRRRDLVLAVAAASLPRLARAQPQRRPHRVGVLMQARRVDELRRGLAALGHVEGETIAVEARPNDVADGLPGFAAELVARGAEVLVAEGSQAIRAARAATGTIPIVMVSASDPVGTGFVASLSRPGGTITGLSLLSPELSGKRLELMREIVPALARVAVLWDPDDPPAALSFRETEAAARRLGIELASLTAHVPDDLEPALAGASRAAAGALVILSAPMFTVEGARIAQATLRLKLPSVYFSAVFPEAGGLMSYGPSLDRNAHRAAAFVDKILNGAHPGDLPVEQPDTFELVLNLGTAAALGLAIPPSVLARADAVIE